LVIGEVTDEGIEVVSGEIWVTIGVELFQGLLGSFGGSHLVVWVASFKEASKFDVGILGESLLCHGQEFADPIEGIPASASVAKDVVLYPSSRLVKASVGELDQVKWIGHDRSVGEDGTKHAPGKSQTDRGFPT